MLKSVSEWQLLIVSIHAKIFKLDPTPKRLTAWVDATETVGE